MAELSRSARAARALDRRPLGSLARRLPLWHGLLVLNYHHVARRAEDVHDAALWSATPEALDEQLGFLAREFDVVGPAEARERPPRRGRRVLLTFDDGYRDNHELAFPLLRRHGLSAVFFLATGYLDDPRLPWWDEIADIVAHATAASLPPDGWIASELALGPAARDATVAELVGVYKRLAPERTEPFLDWLGESSGSGRRAGSARELWMTWEMAREMRDAGMGIGGHTVNHPVLARLDAGAQRAEIAGCRARLEQELGEPMRLFSYPVGLRDSFDERTRAALREEGAEVAFSFYGGFNRAAEWDPLDVRRVSVSAFVDPAEFRAIATMPRLFGRW